MRPLEYTISILLAVLCSVCSTTPTSQKGPPGGGHSKGPWTFHIDLRRFNTTICTYQSIDEIQVQGANIGDGECYTWKDDKAFKGFIYSWLAHVDGEKLEDYGRCNVKVYKEKRCAGSQVANIQNVSRSL